MNEEKNWDRLEPWEQKPDAAEKPEKEEMETGGKTARSEKEAHESSDASWREKPEGDPVWEPGQEGFGKEAPAGDSRAARAGFPEGTAYPGRRGCSGFPCLSVSLWRRTRMGSAGLWPL